MNKTEKIAAFDPSSYAVNDQLFGLPFEYEESDIVVLPVPWEVTVSYNSGTAEGPEAIKQASLQVDLYDPFAPEAWKGGIFMLEADWGIKDLNDKLRPAAEQHLDKLSDEEYPGQSEALEEINNDCAQMVSLVERHSLKLLEEGKKVVLLGGDHSTPLGYMKALASRYESFAILQIDAHADLRVAYEGFEYSHASIMHNAIQLDQVNKLVQVGIRDYCEDELKVINAPENNIVTYFDRDLKYERYNGESWANQCKQILDDLPEHVYVSFDIDGLDPRLCPNTGTPVAGGLEYDEALFLLEELCKSGRKIIGMDLNEVAPGDGEWDANVGARLLYRLCNILATSNK